MRWSVPVVALVAACAGSPAPGPVTPRKLGTPPAQRVQAVLPLVRDAAARHQVPEDLILAVIQVESSFRADACSHVGARGLMQLMPRTASSLARRLGREEYDIEDPAFNIEAGTAYLAYLLRLFDGDLALALAGYNAGPMRVRRWVRDGRAVSFDPHARPALQGRLPASRAMPSQVRRYVATVLAARGRFKRQGVDGVREEEPPAKLVDEGLDRDGLSALVRQKEARYGERPDEPLEEVGGRDQREDPADPADQEGASAGRPQSTSNW